MELNKIKYYKKKIKRERKINERYKDKRERKERNNN